MKCFSIVPAIFLASLALSLLGGCGNQQAASLGAIPVVRTQETGGGPLLDYDLRIRSDDQPTDDPDDYLIAVYVVTRSGDRTDNSTNQDLTGLSADVSNLHRYFYLGEDHTTQAGKAVILAKRRIIAYRLLEVADRNGDEFWRRFSGLMSYARAVKSGSTALLGSSIAASFLSPVLGASLAGVGLAGDSFASDLTADFDIEVYSALRSSVRREVETRRRVVINKLDTRSYDQYPATSVVADICDYAYAYTIRAAMDTLRATARATANDGDTRPVTTDAAPNGAAR